MILQLTITRTVSTQDGSTEEQWELKIIDDRVTVINHDAREPDCERGPSRAVDTEACPDEVLEQFSSALEETHDALC
ncbi:hypothetical protein [Halosegnis longus]|uniref:hypothetical protein n=1 Tax=Halosegnis longus TaxID=2216012 RepID=UPI00129DB2D0|nr:hypothetical protein [Halosegnis longus]